MGKVASGYKKTTMRRNRRQPERLELSGTLRQHKANVWVALDMSGSITDAEFTNALEQVLQIVHAYNHRITVVECDNEVRRTYTMESVKDVKPRLDVRGATAFLASIFFSQSKPCGFTWFTLRMAKARNDYERLRKGIRCCGFLPGRILNYLCIIRTAWFVNSVMWV